MTQEEKQILLVDLCARLPYKVKVYGNYRYSDGDEIVDDEKVEVLNLSKLDWFVNGIDIKPYLRPMSSMTDEEEKIYNSFIDSIATDECGSWELTEWLNEHHFDYHGLIPMGLALPATDDMYK